MNTRQLALTALVNIFNYSKKPKDALHFLYHDIDKRDRAFLMELVYGVLRHRDYLDWMLKDFLPKPSGLHPKTINNLRTAVYQIKYMRVPEWAVVSEAVNIEKYQNGKASLVNAVLRGFLRNKDNIKDPSMDNPVDYISIKTSHPKWLVKRWIKCFGYDNALRLAEANNMVPPIVLRAKDKEQREKILQELAEKEIEAYPTRFSPVGIVLKEFPAAMPELLANRLFIQDEAAQLVAYLLNPSASERILDACAAPGGKTTHIAQIMEDSGEIIAVESEEGRIKQIEENISRLGLKSIKIINKDVKDIKVSDFNKNKPAARRNKEHFELFDKILIDAPCSSIGVIRRNPDVKYRHTEKDMISFKEKQLDILEKTCLFLKKGGIMVYSVCSTEPDEGEEVIKQFLQSHPDFNIIKAEADFLSHFETEDKDGNLFYRTFPHTHNMDGFFAVRLRKLPGI